MKTLISFLLITFSLTGYAQECGTVATPEQMQFLESLRDLQTQSADGRVANVDVRIPVQFHYYVAEEGDVGLSESVTATVMQRLNDFYTPSNIEFFLVNGTPNVIVNPDLVDFNASNEGAAAVGNDIRNVVNVYFFNSIRSAGGAALCGYTRFPPSSDRVFTTYGCTTGGTTLEHEMGHYFTLYHTHGTTNTGTTNELVDGSNCTVAGDFICDTPADPNLSGQVQNCVYVGTATDANGDLYQPDVRNIMSYAPDNCGAIFTNGQHDQIRIGFENGRNYLDFETDGFTANFRASTQEVCVTNQVSFTAIAFGAKSFEWEFEGGEPSTSTVEKPTVTYNAAGTFKVTLTAFDNGGNTTSFTRNNFIEVIDPLSNALDEGNTYNFDTSIGTSFEVENPDLGYTFSFNADVDASNNNSGSLFVNNWDYETNQPFNIDQLLSSYFNAIGVRALELKMDVAYRSRKGEVKGQLIIPDIHDSLAVDVLGICGEAPERVWISGGSELSNSSPLDEAFIPSSSDDWKKVSIPIQIKEGQEFAQIILTSISYNGNNLYIDNIDVALDYSLNVPENFRAASVSDNQVTLRWNDNNVNELGYLLERKVGDEAFKEIATIDKNVLSFKDDDIVDGKLISYRLTALGYQENKSEATQVVEVDNFVLSLEEEIKQALGIYPNPASDLIHIQNSRVIQQAQLMDLSGRILKSTVPNTHTLSMDISDVKYSGLYILALKIENQSITQKIYIQK